MTTLTCCKGLWTSLVVQWLRICLLMQQTMGLIPGLGGFHMPKTVKSPCTTTTEVCTLPPGLCSKTGHRNAKPAPRNWRVAPTRCNWRKPALSNKNPVQPKIKKFLSGRTTQYCKAVMLQLRRNTFEINKQINILKRKGVGFANIS